MRGGVFTTLHSRRRRQWSSAAVQRLASREAKTVTWGALFSVHPVAITGSWDGLLLDFSHFLHPYFQRVAGSSITAPLDLKKVSLHRVATGQVVPVTFAGARTKTIAPGERHVLSDEVTPSAFGLSVFGTEVYRCRIWFEVPVGASISVTNTASATWEFNAGGATLPNVDSTDPFWPNDGINQGIGGFSYGPVVVGRTSATRKPAFFLTGDSLLDGYAPSYMMDAFSSLSNPCIEFSMGGTSQVDLSWDTSWTSYMRYCDALIDEQGTNAHLVTDKFGYWDIAKVAHGHALVAHIGGLARASSSNQFVDAAGQTPVLGGTWWDTLETFLATEVAAGRLAIQHKMMSVRDPSNPRLWLTDGTPYKYTVSDGLHQTAASNPLLTAEAAPLIAALAGIIRGL